MKYQVGAVTSLGFVGKVRFLFILLISKLNFLKVDTRDRERNTDVYEREKHQSVAPTCTPTGD